MRQSTTRRQLRTKPELLNTAHDRLLTEDKGKNFTNCISETWVKIEAAVGQLRHRVVLALSVEDPVQHSVHSQSSSYALDVSFF